jgi:hypothetical protein
MMASPPPFFHRAFGPDELRSEIKQIYSDATVAERCSTHGINEPAHVTGDELVDAYVKLRMGEWQDYMRHLTQWERDRTLDCRPGSRRTPGNSIIDAKVPPRRELIRSRVARFTSARQVSVARPA